MGYYTGCISQVLTDVKYLDLFVKSGLRIASGMGCIDAVQYMVERNAFIPKDYSGAIVNATSISHQGLIKYLVECKADPTMMRGAVNIAMRPGDVKSLRYLLECRASFDEDRLLFASSKGNIDIIKCSIEFKADVSANDHLAVRWASEVGLLSAVRCLVENKADTYVALESASRHGHLGIVQYLVEQLDWRARLDTWTSRDISSNIRQMSMLRFGVQV